MSGDCFICAYITAHILFFIFLRYTIKIVSVVTFFKVTKVIITFFRTVRMIIVLL